MVDQAVSCIDLSLIRLTKLYHILTSRWYSWPCCIIYWPVINTDDQAVSSIELLLIQMTKLYHLLTSHWYRWPSCIIYWPVTDTDDRAVSSIDLSLIQMTKLYHLLTCHWYRWPSCFIYSCFMSKLLFTVFQFIITGLIGILCAKRKSSYVVSIYRLFWLCCLYYLQKSFLN
jgi:hypothetical protein